MQLLKKLQESRINPIVQLSKHYYRRSKHEGGLSMCAAMNGFFHRIHLRQTNDSKVITIRHEKDLEQIEKPTTDSGNLYGP